MSVCAPTQVDRAGSNRGHADAVPGVCGGGQAPPPPCLVATRLTTPRLAPRAQVTFVLWVTSFDPQACEIMLQSGAVKALALNRPNVRLKVMRVAVAALAVRCRRVMGGGGFGAWLVGDACAVASGCRLPATHLTPHPRVLAERGEGRRRWRPVPDHHERHASGRDAAAARGRAKGGRGRGDGAWRPGVASPSGPHAR